MNFTVQQIYLLACFHHGDPLALISTFSATSWHSFLFLVKYILFSFTVLSGWGRKGRGDLLARYHWYLSENGYLFHLEDVMSHISAVLQILKRRKAGISSITYYWFSTLSWIKRKWELDKGLKETVKLSLIIYMNITWIYM